MGDRSIREFFSSPTRYLAEAISKESEFEKPYLDDDRGRMHNDPSWPDWPPFPDIPPWPPLPPFEGPVPGLPGCAITCYPPHNDCDNPVWCHPSIWCGIDMGCKLCSWEVEGAIKGYEPHNSGVGSWGIDIWIDEDLVEEGGEALITACMTDPCGNVCCEDIEVTCKICPPDVVMTFDDPATADTIGRNASINIHVKDGVGYYSWSVAGTGFSIPSRTEGVINVLSTDNTACGPATITVTDFCGDSVTIYIRCTEGSDWIPKTADTCVMPGPGTFVSFSSPFIYYEYVVGYRKQIDRIQTRGGGFELACPDPCDDPTCAGGLMCDPYSSPLPCLTNLTWIGNPVEVPCTKATWISEDQFSCYSAALSAQDYYEWECI